MANYHVTKRIVLDEWTEVREIADRPSATATTQSAAELLAKKYARNSGGGDLRIH